MTIDRGDARQRKAARVVKKAIRDGLLTLPEICAKCDVKPSYTLIRYFPDYDQPLDVIVLCKKCNFARMERSPRNYDGRIGYATMRRLVIDQGLSFNEVGRRHEMNAQSLHNTFKRRAQRHGEWEEIHAMMQRTQGERVRAGLHRTYNAVNGLMIWGLLEDHLEEVKLFRVNSAGVTVELGIWSRKLAFARRAQICEFTIRKYLKQPDQLIQRELAIKILVALGEELPNWPEARKERERKWHRDAKDRQRKVHAAKI